MSSGTASAALPAHSAREPDTTAAGSARMGMRRADPLSEARSTRAVQPGRKAPQRRRHRPRLRRAVATARAAIGARMNDAQLDLARTWQGPRDERYFERLRSLEILRRGGGEGNGRRSTWPPRRSCPNVPRQARRSRLAVALDAPVLTFLRRYIVFARARSGLDVCVAWARPYATPSKPPTRPLTRTSRVPTRGPAKPGCSKRCGCSPAAGRALLHHPDRLNALSDARSRLRGGDRYPRRAGCRVP